MGGRGQLPTGAWPVRWGRKPFIVGGFAVGALLAGVLTGPARTCPATSGFMVVA
jgi:hypothetical protein